MDISTLLQNSDSEFSITITSDDEDDIAETRKMGTDCSNRELMAVLQSVKSDTKESRELLGVVRKDLDTHVAKTEEKFNEIAECMEKTKSDIETLFSRVRKCEVGSTVSSYDVELQKQKSLKNNISIAGIPTYDGENLNEIFNSILQILEFRQTDVRTTSIYRVHDSRSHLIVVRLESFESKLELLKARRSKKIKVSDIVRFSKNSSSEGEREVTLNNQLTPYFSNLMYHGRKVKESELIHSSWISNRGFVVKRNLNDKPTEIKNVDHLNEFTQSKQLKRRNSEFDTSSIDKANPRAKPRIGPKSVVLRRNEPHSGGRRDEQPRQRQQRQNKNTKRDKSNEK